MEPTFADVRRPSSTCASPTPRPAGRSARTGRSSRRPARACPGLCSRAASRPPCATWPPPRPGGVGRPAMRARLVRSAVPAGGSSGSVFSDTASSPYKNGHREPGRGGHLSAALPTAPSSPTPPAPPAVRQDDRWPRSASFRRRRPPGSLISEPRDANGYPHQVGAGGLRPRHHDRHQRRPDPVRSLELPSRRDQVVSMIVRGLKRQHDRRAGRSSGRDGVAAFAAVDPPHGDNLRIAEYNGLLSGLRAWDRLGA